VNHTISPTELKGRWALGLAAGGFLACCALGVVGLLYGLMIEGRTSGNGPHWLVEVALLGLPLIEACALALGSAARNRRAGRCGLVVSITVLAVYFLVWPGLGIIENLGELVRNGYYAR
jgi:hypothetical protein